MSGAAVRTSGGWAARLEDLRTYLLYVALTIEIAVVIVDKSELHDPYESLFFRLTFVLTLAVVLLGSYTRREWAAIAAAAAFGFLSYRLTGRNEILRAVVFVAACKGQPRERMLKTAFWETLAGCAGIALLSITGVYGARLVDMKYRLADEERTRYCFGFGHPNALHCMFYMLVLLGMLAYGKKLRWPHYLALFAANIGMYLITDSRTGSVIAAATILAGALLQFSDERAQAGAGGRGALRERRGLYVAGGAAVLLSAAFSVWAAYESYYLWAKDAGGEVWLRPGPLDDLARNMDRVLSNRISDLYWAHEHAGITSWSLFSSRAAERYFDMGWCRLFYWYGIVPGVLAVLLLLLLIADCCRRRDGIALAVIVFLSIYTVVEAHLVSVYIGRNFLLLLFGAAWPAMLRLDTGRGTGLPALLERRSA